VTAGPAVAERARPPEPLATGAVLYECRIFHARRAPLHHAFSYRTYHLTQPDIALLQALLSG
jgi:DUF1365 family protein